MTREASKFLNSLQTKLLSVSDDVAQLYHLICTVNGETPSVVHLNHGKFGTLENDASQENLCPEGFALSSIVKELSETVRVGETLQDQVKHLRSSVSITIESLNNRDYLVSDLLSQSDKVSDLNEQVTQLKSLLSSKREQIATLRLVLETNKRIAEVALNNIKTKYEAYRVVDRDTTMKLRSELKLLKEEVASFSSLRATFATRCQEYETQITELQCQMAASNNKKKTSKQALVLAGGRSRIQSTESRNNLLQPVLALEDTTPSSNDGNNAAGLLERQPQMPFRRSQIRLSTPLVAATSSRVTVAPTLSTLSEEAEFIGDEKRTPPNQNRQ